MTILAKISPLALLILPACCTRPPAVDLSQPSAWTQRGGKAVYTFDGGMIVGETRPNQPNSFLCTVQDFGDFDLEYDFLVDKELNSGVQIRSHSKPDYRNGVVHGLQVEIDPSARAWTAGIYEEAGREWLFNLKNNPAAQKAFRQGEWNHVRVRARGDSIRTWLNGVAAADLKASVEPEGFIALQVHDVGPRADPLRVRWKNIELRPMNPESAAR